AGLGLGLSPLTNAATSSVPLAEVGIASSVLALARNVAGAFGIAIFATVLSNSTTSHLLAIQQHSVVNTVDPNVFRQVVPLMITKANILAFSSVFKTATLFLLIGGVAALFVKESKKDFSGKADLDHPIEI
ncbi:MAG: hypothetical protein M1142_02930, partial [Patescibacteria group bacterium]|nr:hypothetical protein [Patescibacteria group bacterium]